MQCLSAPTIFSAWLCIMKHPQKKVRVRKGQGEKLQISMKNQEVKNWKEFLSNSENKRQLSQVLCQVWGNHGREV